MRRLGRANLRKDARRDVYSRRALLGTRDDGLGFGRAQVDDRRAEPVPTNRSRFTSKCSNGNTNCGICRGGSRPGKVWPMEWERFEDDDIHYEDWGLGFPEEYDSHEDVEGEDALATNLPESVDVIEVCLDVSPAPVLRAADYAFGRYRSYADCAAGRWLVPEDLWHVAIHGAPPSECWRP